MKKKLLIWDTADENSFAIINGVRGMQKWQVIWVKILIHRTGERRRENSNRERVNKYTRKNICTNKRGINVKSSQKGLK